MHSQMWYLDWYTIHDIKGQVSLFNAMLNRPGLVEIIDSLFFFEHSYLSYYRRRIYMLLNWDFLCVPNLIFYLLGNRILHVSFRSHFLLQVNYWIPFFNLFSIFFKLTKIKLELLLKFETRCSCLYKKYAKTFYWHSLQWVPNAFSFAYTCTFE